MLAATAMGGLSEVWGEVSQAAGAAERLNELLAMQSEIRSAARPRAAAASRRAARSTSARCPFSYPTRPEISALHGVSFHVTPGERVAIVGPSGAGKTTIFALLLRFYDPKGGAVSVDGVPVNEASLADSRSRFAIVPQETALFADTIADNIGYGAA